MYLWEKPCPCVYPNLYNILCTVNTQRASRQDAIITVMLYLATCFCRDRPSSDQLRTMLRCSTIYPNVVLRWPEDCRSRPKHVAKYNQIVIIVSCFDVCCVLTVHIILYKFEIFTVHTTSQTLASSLSNKDSMVSSSLLPQFFTLLFRASLLRAGLQDTHLTPKFMVVLFYASTQNKKKMTTFTFSYS